MLRRTRSGTAVHTERPSGFTCGLIVGQRSGGLSILWMTQLLRTLDDVPEVGMSGKHGDDRLTATLLRHLAYDDVGTGPGIVLIHGHPFNRSLWSLQMRSLSDAFRVLAPDLPGHGASAPRGDKVTMGEFAGSVIDVMDEAELSRGVVVGLSMGALVAIELALAAPARVAGLVVVAASVAPVTPAEAQERRRVADEIERVGMLPLVLDMGPKLFGSDARCDPGIVDPVIEMMLKTPPAGAAAALRGRAERPDYRTRLATLDIPSLVIVGTEDPYLGDQQVAELMASLPDPTLIRLEGVGHLPNVEAPTLFDANLRAFVRRASEARP